MIRRWSARRWSGQKQQDMDTDRHTQIDIIVPLPHQQPQPQQHAPELSIINYPERYSTASHVTTQPQSSPASTKKHTHQPTRRVGHRIILCRQHLIRPSWHTTHAIPRYVPECSTHVPPTHQYRGCVPGLVGEITCQVDLAVETLALADAATLGCSNQRL